MDKVPHHWRQRLERDIYHRQAGPLDSVCDQLEAGQKSSEIRLTGLTALAGVHRALRPRSGGTLVVSSAAGAVGLVLGQLGTKLGCRRRRTRKGCTVYRRIWLRRWHRFGLTTSPNSSQRPHPTAWPPTSITPRASLPTRWYLGGPPMLP